ncbi:MAG: DUF1318 domain-containing protein [Gammaproteobacteria bacterium]|nr:MAG: DUF1318 domain-containing protein [Gammaproteobacteria bacterium]
MTAPRIALWPAFLLLTACVTINIYFPAAAAEKAADVIIKEILDTDAVPAAAEPQANLSKRPPVWLARLQPLVDWLVPAVQAAEADLNVQTAAITRLRTSMKQRFPQLQPHFVSGAIGFTADGLVALRNVSALPLAQRASLNPLIAAENRDRNALYQEIARANNHPDWEAQIRSTFAARWVSNAAKGWWYENASGWHQK